MLSYMLGDGGCSACSGAGSSGGGALEQVESLKPGPCMACTAETVRLTSVGGTGAVQTDQIDLDEI